MAGNFGSTVSVFVTNEDGVSDLDWTGTLITGKRAVAESILKRWLTVRGTLITDPSVGANLRAYLSLEFSDTKEGLDALRQELVLEALRDDRVSSIVVSPKLDAQAETLTISATVTTDDGDVFDFVATIDKVDATLVFPTAENA